MATCPECRAELGDDVQTCPEHGCALISGELALPEERPLEEGAMVGEYRIQGKLGAGTFGEVYAGEQPLIGKRVAVKVLNRRFASDPVMVSRFVAEARAVNKIRQRNIIDIFSFGVVPGLDRHYFVMELLDGMTLGALLDRTGRLPVALVLPVVRGVADALDAVHEAGITHRDLKPDNVFLARERDGSYFPKLLDFGIAKLLGEDVAHKTGSGMVLGTPRYMSPEQARGKKADHRADIYALGVMIHEMLTGGPLFEGDSAVDMLLKHAVDDPPRVSDVCPDLPPGLDEPVLAMLRKRPTERPNSAGQAVAALAACAQRLGLDRATVTLAELTAEATRTTRSDDGGAPPGIGDARHTATTMTIGRPARVAVSAASGGARPDPTGKTEHAPASDAKSAPQPTETLVSGPGSGAVDDRVDGDVSSRSAPTTETVSTLETSSAIKRLTRARRVKVAAGAAAVTALAAGLFALGAFGHRGAAAISLPMAPSITTLSTAGLEPARAKAAEPTATVEAGPPAPLTMEASPPDPRSGLLPAADGGAPARPGVTAPSSPSTSRQARPSKGAGKMDRILGDRD